MSVSKSGPDELCSMLKSLQINWHLAKLSVYSVVLRGVRTTEDLTPQRLRYVGRSGELPHCLWTKLIFSRRRKSRMSIVYPRFPRPGYSVSGRVSYDMAVVSRVLTIGPNSTHLSLHQSFCSRSFGSSRRHTILRPSLQTSKRSLRHSKRFQDNYWPISSLKYSNMSGTTFKNLNSAYRL